MKIMIKPKSISLQQNTSAPCFTKNLEPLSVSEGEPAKFVVEFGGEPAPDVKWFRYSFQVQNSEDFQITTTNNQSTLLIKKTCSDDSGIFTCLIENIVGSFKTSANLNVVESGQEYTMEASTKTSRSLKEMNVHEGDNIRFDIQFTSGDKSNLKFMHNDKEIKENQTNEDDVKISVENDVATLLIANANSKHSGQYVCHMKTEGGEATCSVKCNVLPKKS